MKKLLIIALLMLALVITAVACNDDPVEPGTSGDEVTTVETPTEAPTDEPSTPAPETEPETPAPETDPETPAPETDPETPAPETEPETPAPETEPETEPDPADPVFMLDAEALNTLAGAAAPNVQQLGSTEVITEGSKTFVRWTTAGGDPYVAIIPLGSDYTLPQYMAISYRTNSTKDGQFFLGSGAGWTGAGDSFMAAWTEGDWSFLIIDLTQTGVTSITDGKLTYCRLDFFTDAGNEGDYFDVQYIGFFNTAEYAAAYDFEMNKAPHWTETPDQIKHQSFDQLYAGTGDAGNGDENIFTPGHSADWDFVADYSDIAYADFTVDTLTYWGWIGFMGEKGQFGYQIDMNAAVYNDEFAFVGGDHEGIINAAKGAGADSGHRMKIAISLAGLEGEHTVRAMYKTGEGMEICLNEFTVKLPTRPTHYDNYTVPQDQWVITGHNTNLNDSSNPMVAAGGVESGALLHQGSIALGEVDLSKYSKVVVMWGCDNSAVTVGHYDANANNRIMLLNAEMSNVMSPAEETILAGGTYELKGWAVTAFEIDLTDVDYNGPVWLAIDALPGTFALVASVEFIGAEIDYTPVEPEEPETPDEPETPEEPETPVEPDVPTVENLVIPQDQWVISGHCTTLVGKEGHDNSPMVAAGGVDSAALLHQGSIALGEIDLSKYSKVVIMWGSDNGPDTQDLYAKNEHNRFALVNADKNMQMSPNEDTIVAAVTYELHGWAVAPIEIDLTGIDYNGPLFLTHDSLAGGFALVYSIEFVA